MRASAPLVVAALALLLPPAAGGPTDDSRAKLESLRKRLPGVVAAWARERWHKGDPVQLRLVRRVGPDEVKVTLRCGDDPKTDQLLTIYLRYHDGLWTTTRFESTWEGRSSFNDRAARFLMLAIDESASK
jgi:hypothetical protein